LHLKAPDGAISKTQGKLTPDYPEHIECAEQTRHHASAVPHKQTQEQAMKVIQAIIITGALALSSNAAIAGDAEAGKTAFATKGCAGCHGAGGAAPTSGTPKLAGKDAITIKQALSEFKSGTRSSPVMNGMAGMLSDGDIDNIAAYFGAQ